MKSIKAIDFFSGAGGLTSGLKMAGIDVFAGIDFEKSCKESYEKNNSQTASYNYSPNNIWGILPF